MYKCIYIYIYVYLKSVAFLVFCNVVCCSCVYWDECIHIEMYVRRGLDETVRRDAYTIRLDEKLRRDAPTRRLDETLTRDGDPKNDVQPV